MTTPAPKQPVAQEHRIFLPSRRPMKTAQGPIKEKFQADQQPTGPEEGIEGRRLYQPTQRKTQELVDNQDDLQGIHSASEDGYESDKNDIANEKDSDLEVHVGRVKHEDSVDSTFAIIDGGTPDVFSATSVKRKAPDNDERQHKKRFTASTSVDVQMADLELKHERELYSQKCRADRALAEERHRTRVFDFVKEMHIRMFGWDSALYLEHVGPSMAGRMGNALRGPQAAE